MTRLSFVLMLVACVGMSAGIAIAQDDVVSGSGTVWGQIVDTTTAENPIDGVEVRIVGLGNEEYTATTDANGDYERSGIPAGRYLISIYKEGYGDRLGKPVTVAPGGDHYVPLRMTKDNIITFFFKKFGFVFWILFFCGITALLTFLFTKRWMTEKLTPNEHRWW